MKKTYLFYTILSILLLVIIFLFYDFVSKSDKSVSTKKEYIPIELEQDSVTKEIKVKNFKHDTLPTSDTNKTKTYKEVFQEPKDMPLAEKLEIKNELSKLDEESKQIIQKTEELIKENNLELPQKELSQKEEEKLQKQTHKIEKLRKQLEELSDE